MHLRIRPSLRLSVRTTAVLVIVVGFAAAAALGFVTYQSAGHRAATNEQVAKTTDTIAVYQKLQIAMYDESGAVAGYYSLRDPAFVQRFRDARTRADSLFASLRASAAAGGPTSVTTLNTLAARHTKLADADEQVLEALGRNDLASVFRVAGQTDLIHGSDTLLQDLGSTIDGLRAELRSAQRQDQAAQTTASTVALSITGAWALFLAIIGLATFWWVVRPMERMRRSTRAIAAGDRSARVPETGPMELAQVGADVNAMAEALIKRSDELRAYLSRNLEARTVELEEANDALRNSEERFRSLVQNASDMITIVDAGGTPIYASPSVERIMGYRPEDWAGINIVSLIHPDDLERAAESLAAVARAPGLHPPTELRVLHRDGSYRYLEMVANNLLDDPGVRGIVHNSRDITERKHAEAALQESEQKFRLLFADNPDTMWVYDLETLAFLEVNEAAVDRYGYSREQFLQMRITDIRPAEDIPRLRETLDGRAVLQHSGEWRHRLRDGRLIDVDITSHLVEFEGRRASLVVVLDITERKRAEHALQRSEERFRSLVQNASDLITVIGPDTTILYQSASVERLLGYRAADVMGQRLSELVHPEDVTHLLAFLSDAMNKPDGTDAVEVRLRHRDGSWRSVEIVGTDRRHDAAVDGFVLNTRDVTERKLLEEQLRHQAFHDPLTKLANRARFVDRLEHALERAARSDTRLAVLFMDIDNFKAVNDSLGHSAGDGVLVEVATRLQSCLRAGDTAARFGGDEFAVLIEDLTETGEANRLGERILDALRRPMQLAGKEVFVRASIGVAVGSAPQAPNELLRDADVAMYVAKARGKARIECFEASMHDSMVRRLELVADLQRAMERHEFVVVYQPTVLLATGDMVGVEALVRWQHPERGLILPAEFIPLAEESGVISALGRWVLDTACHQTRQWQTSHSGAAGFSVAVNVSVRQLQQTSFTAEVAQALEASGLAPQDLILEVTESVMMQDIEATVAVLRDLKRLGVRLAIDDFGTGYSSLSYLAQFPFDILKIDKSFVDGADAEGSQIELTRAIIDLGRTLHLEIVAEGIERAEQLAQLQALRCDLGQGYLFAHPLRPDQIDDLLRHLHKRPRAA
ncbi:MAG: bifunctional diguanylate cyclase/phosphodiesterase [Dehalococcoidia bacterium]